MTDESAKIPTALDLIIANGQAIQALVEAGRQHESRLDRLESRVDEHQTNMRAIELMLGEASRIVADTGRLANQNAEAITRLEQAIENWLRHTNNGNQ
jgi:hypothetical protein